MWRSDRENLKTPNLLKQTSNIRQAYTQLLHDLMHIYMYLKLLAKIMYPPPQHTTPPHSTLTRIVHVISSCVAPRRTPRSPLHGLHGRHVPHPPWPRSGHLRVPSGRRLRPVGRVLGRRAERRVTTSTHLVHVAPGGLLVVLRQVVVGVVGRHAGHVRGLVVLVGGWVVNLVRSASRQDLLQLRGVLLGTHVLVRATCSCRQK